MRATSPPPPGVRPATQTLPWAAARATGLMGTEIGVESVSGGDPHDQSPLGVDHPEAAVGEGDAGAARADRP